jgi:tetratricopeptide (TPR) repeat protein
LKIAAHQSIGFTSLLMNRLLNSKDHFQTSMSGYNAEDHLALVGHYGIDPGVNCMSLSAITLWLLGFPDQSLSLLKESLKTMRQLTDPSTLAITQSWAARIYPFYGDTKCTRQWADVTIDYSSQHDIALCLAEGKLMKGWAMAMNRQPEALDLINVGLSSKRQSGSLLLIPYYLYLVAEAFAQLNQVDQALALIDEAIDTAQSTGEQWWEAEIHRLRGELLHTYRANDESAEQCFVQAKEMASDVGAKSLELRATMSLHALWLTQNRRVNSDLATIYSEFSEGFATADLAKARRLLKIADTVEA